MKARLMFAALLAAALMADGAARASAVRTGAMGGVEAIVEDESNSINLFNAGNAAGLGLLPRENRIDEQVIIGVASTEDVYPGGSKRSMSDRAFALVSPGGTYQGVQYWITSDDAIRVSAGFDSLSRTVSVDPGSAPDATYRMSDTVIAAQYARKLTDNLAIGARVRPIAGNLAPPAGAGAALLGGTPSGEKYVFTLLDWNAGLAYRTSIGGEDRVVFGLDIMPYNDTPDPADLLAALGAPAGAGTGTLGAYNFKYEATVAGQKITSNATTTGTTVGGQFEYAGGGNEFGLLLDLTTATVDRKDNNPFGERSGTQARYSRMRYRIEGRRLVDMGKDAGVRIALALGGATGRLDNLNYPDSEDVVTTTDQAPFDMGLGFSYVTGKFVVGLGYSLDTEKDSQKAAKSGDDPLDTTSADSVVRLGGEYWFTPEWAGRMGLAMGSRTRDANNDASPTPGEEGNPIENDTALSLGAGYKGSNGLLVDAALVVHALGSDPEPRDYREARSQTDILLAGRYAF